MRIGICDEDRFMTGKIEEELLKLGKEYDLRLDIEVFFDGAELWEDIQENGAYDILYLDIEMKHMNGLTVARNIRMSDPYTVLIFISAYDSYCKSLFDVEPFRFLDKPIDRVKFKKYFISAMERITDINQRFTFVAKQETFQVPYKKIAYFEKRLRVIYVHTSDKVYQYYGSMEEVWERVKVSGKYFIRVGKSYIVNYNNIRSMSMSKVLLDNDLRITMGGDYREDAWNRYTSLMGEN